MHSVRPKKALGQHFLTDTEIAARIAATMDPYLGLPIVEIGPGMGVLTRPLLERGHDLRVIEIDAESAAYLRSEMPQLKADRLIEGDFLKMDLGELFPDGSEFCVIGNYPYNISSQIFFHLLQWRSQVPAVAGMLQKEVAERLAAPAGTKARGILSVLLQAWYEVEYLFTVDEWVFDPAPKVKSGVIRLRRNGREALGCDEADFRRVVKTAFGQRRKTLRNSLRPLLAQAPAAAAASPLMALRPEQLQVDQFVELTQLLYPPRR